MDLTSYITNRLHEHLQDALVEVIDESHKHKGHMIKKGAHPQGGHYNLCIVTKDFETLSRLERHRKIYALFEKDIPHLIHALRLALYTPLEYDVKKSQEQTGLKKDHLHQVSP